ncbi:conjugal transfer protein TraN [Novosphingobium album (ex Liu et al. 2023)]|uniref:Conjugal transfer protein TraN n=1 Tax=Novosphingobium album (ex Liu et al. 2023) TaxID=3031130 RepID=A0ABT5WQG0_9SPHN|nr:conjugal transfer protein TraN [Novosphingobium album (ex Liu et al. 2023)]MDE8652248.1 conjugal transfer protein TraN [Novosphingobium album (ex Liu et al. 2023)]
MKRLLLPILCLAACACLPASVCAQTTTDAAKADGKAFGRDKATAAQGAATTEPDASRIPNFGGVPSEASHFDDPDRMAREAASQAAANTGYRTMRDSMDHRARFAPEDLDAVVARSNVINDDPLSYTSGMSVTSTQGRCVPLPPGSASPGTYRATCNTGYELEPDPMSCTVPLQVNVETTYDYLYYCSPSGSGESPGCAGLPAGICARTGSHPGACVQATTSSEGTEACAGPGEPIDEYTCSSEIAGWIAQAAIAEHTVTAARDESGCAAHDANAMCVDFVETCSDSSPVTRMVNGVQVTQPCWAWRRDYSCYRYRPANDCEPLAARPECRVVSEQCITDETPCRTFERAYECALPEEQKAADQFICDGDVYCINGSCETIEREPNDEFKDAVVALNAMGQARREWDPDTLTLFKGERETCHSKVFGVVNCCKGRGFPLIPGISLLVALGCDREEILLHQRDAQGLCAYVGTYCSDKILGVCVTKKKVYCCFESRLTRILQEQGRQQLSKPWNKPRREQCLGFTIDEFSRLDLSKMDFSEVYAEFTEAARLPDELEAATEIQRKIEDYYARASQ